MLRRKRSADGKKPRLTWKIALGLLMPAIALIAADRLIAPHYRVAFNESKSLPGTLYLVETGAQPKCGVDGDFVQFRMPSDARWYTDQNMLKVAKGCPGDEISIVDRQVYINGWLAGDAVPELQDGTPMEIIQAGVIPEGHYYMWASHPSSFDSRYAEFKLIPEEQVIGAARKIF